MKTVIVEATNGPRNWGKFLIGRFDSEWERFSEVDPDRVLLGRCGWSTKHIVVLDLQTGEGAIFLPGGLAAADLEKHRVWVCPLFEPFLAWLYAQDLNDLDALPKLIDLPDAPFAMHGYRRSGEQT
jgi:hypothetical protein